MLNFDNTSDASGNNPENADEENQSQNEAAVIADGTLAAKQQQGDDNIQEEAAGETTSAAQNIFQQLQQTDLIDGDGSQVSDEADADTAPIEFAVDEETTDKLQAIKNKANRLLRLPDDRVLDETSQE